MRDNNSLRAANRRSIILAGGSILGLGAFSSVQATQTQDEPEWPVGVPDEEPEPGDREGEPVPEDPNYEEQQTIVDDTRSIQLTIPAAWSDVDGMPEDIGPSIVAAPDLSGYIDTWNVPGLEVVATTQLGSDPEAVLDQLADFSVECADGGRREVQIARYNYLAQVWHQCGGSGTMFLSMVGTPLDEATNGGSGNERQFDGWVEPGNESPDGGLPNEEEPDVGGETNGSEDVPTDAPYLVLFGAQIVTEQDLDAVFAALDSLEVRPPETWSSELV